MKNKDTEKKTIRPALNGVTETMLQSFYARAQYSLKKDHKIYDAKAVEIVQKLDYDFTLADRDAVMGTGVIARTILLDRLVQAFVQKNPSGTVVNIACGLDTRFYRMDNGTIRWYNLDLPETIAVRRSLFDEEGRVSMIAKSAMDETWPDEIEQKNGPTLFILEGLVMYLSEKDVRQILSIIDRNFPQAEVIMEVMSPWIVKHMKEKSIEATAAKFTWGLRSGRELAAMAPSFAWRGDVSLVEGMKVLYPVYHLFGWIPAVRNISNKLVVLEKQGETGR